MERPLDAIDACADLTDEQLRGELARRDRVRMEARVEEYRVAFGDCPCGGEMHEIQQQMVDEFYERAPGDHPLFPTRPGALVGGEYEITVICERGHKRLWRQIRVKGEDPGPLMPIGFHSNCENGGTSCRDCPGCSNPALGCAC